MYNLLKSTYTYATLKENVFKALGEFSVNGTENSLSKGFTADVEKKYISALNICLRRVSLSLPLLIKTVDLQFNSGKAVLPDDFGKAEAVFVNGIGYISPSSYRINADTIECFAVGDGGYAAVTYRVMPLAFNPDMPASAPVQLPDITADALCYLTAAELCPAEYGELYSKLMYKYRDICLNYYNCEKDNGSRNSFFKPFGHRRISHIKEV